jgi:hypothetical protein
MPYEPGCCCTNVEPPVKLDGPRVIEGNGVTDLDYTVREADAGQR